jgi:aspartyl/asparaginyl beta-hydroxylase (cupin superfamily)
MNISKLSKHWEVLANEMKSIREVFPNVRRPKVGAWSDLDPILYQNIVKSEGWFVVDETDDKWWNFPLFVYGKPTRPALKLAPQTVKILQKIGGVYFCGFSILLPEGFITPHWDEPSCKDDIGRWTYHLGLDCPDHCYLIQGDTAYKEENGKLFRFICNQTHSAVNMSAERRGILYATFIA